MDAKLCELAFAWTPAHDVSALPLTAFLNVQLADEAEELQSLWAALSQPEIRRGSPRPLTPLGLPAWYDDPDITPPLEASEPPPDAGPSQSLDLPGYLAFPTLPVPMMLCW